MRIGIDITFLLDQFAHRGIGNYGRELVKRLINSNNHEWVLFGFDKSKQNALALNTKFSNNVKFVSLGEPKKSSPLNLLWFNFFWKKKILKERLDLFFAPHFERGLPIGKVKTAVMVHDIIPLITGKYSPKSQIINFLKGLFYRSQLKQAKKANLIFTNSDFTKRELVNKAGFDERKIKRTYLGINPEFLKPTDEDETREIRRILNMYSITSPYLLYYGGLEANKNISLLVNSFRIISQRFPDLKLVIAGKEFKVGWDNKPKPLTPEATNLYEQVIEQKLKHSVIFTGEIDQKHLPAILRHAKAFLHLSTYEGFGLSALEALASGVPLIAGRYSSYPEVLGSAPHYLDSNNPQVVAQTIIEVLTDAKLAESHIQEGLNFTKKYSWENCAKETLSAFESLKSPDAKYNITFVTQYFYPFSANSENYQLNLATNLINDRHKVTVLTSKYDSKLSKYELFNGIIISRFNNILKQKIYPGLFWKLLFLKTDIIHIFGVESYWQNFCIYIYRIFNRKVIILNSANQNLTVFKNQNIFKRIIIAIYRTIFKIFLKRTFNKTIISNPSQITLLNSYGIKATSSLLIPQTLNETSINTDTTKLIIKQNRLTKKYLLSTVIDASNKRGFNDIMAAIKLIIGEYPDVRLILITNLTETEASELIDPELKNTIIIVNDEEGKRSEFLSISKIYIEVSEYDDYGANLIEALSYGNVIISGRTNAAKYLVTDAKNGFLYEFGDVVELSRLVKNIIMNEKLRSKMSVENKLIALEFKPEKALAIYLKLVSQIKHGQT